MDKRGFTSLIVLLLAAIANAQAWTSPDGLFSVTPPDVDRFNEVSAPPAPFIALWVSDDETMRFGVMQTQVPPNIKLIQSSAEEGLADEIGGQVTRLPTKWVSEHEVWTMTAKGPAAEITQAMVRHDGTLYKLMAVTMGANHDHALVNAFIDSLSISQPKPADTQPSNRPETQPLRDLGGGVDLHNLSKTIGGASALLVIGILVYLVMRGKKVGNRDRTGG